MGLMASGSVILLASSMSLQCLITLLTLSLSNFSANSLVSSLSTSGMGTKFEYSINLLATSAGSNNLTVGGVDVWEHYQKKGVTNNGYSLGINKFQDPMDRMLDRNNIESIKKTMKMHEDIFKHQVRELHRVYSVQKMLMDDLKNENRHKKFRNPMNSNSIGISNPHFIEQQQQKTTQFSYGPDFHVQNLREDHLCSKERSGSCSGDTIKMQRGFDLEMPADEDFCKISTDIGSDEEMEVDLTLSIGGSQVKKKKEEKKTCHLNSSLSFQSDRVGGEYSDPTTPMSSSSVTFDQERKGPQAQLHWLSQGLKLK